MSSLMTSVHVYAETNYSNLQLNCYLYICRHSPTPFHTHDHYLHFCIHSFFVASVIILILQKLIAKDLELVFSDASQLHCNNMYYFLLILLNICILYKYVVLLQLL